MATATFIKEVTDLITIKDLASLFTSGNTSISYDTNEALVFNEFLYNGETVLVCKEAPYYSYSYNEAKRDGLVDGKIITIGKYQYLIRLITGTSPGPGSSQIKGGEYDDLCYAHESKFDLLQRYTMCREADVTSNDYYFVRGYDSKDYFRTIHKTYEYNFIGFRPLLIGPIKTFECDRNDHHFGEITAFEPLTYTVKPNLDEMRYNLVEKLDGTEIGRADNLISSTTRTIDISNKWSEFQEGSSHMINIELTELGVDPPAKRVITFTFTKSNIDNNGNINPGILLPLSDNATLEDVILYNQRLDSYLTNIVEGFAFKLSNGDPIPEDEKKLSIVS